MALLKHINRLRQIDRLIRTQATGTPQEFANKVGISRSTLMKYLSEMKFIGGKVCYCRYRQSYYYEDMASLQIRFSKEALSQKEENSIIGGKFFPEIFPVRIYRTLDRYVAGVFTHAR